MSALAEAPSTRAARPQKYRINVDLSEEAYRQLQELTADRTISAVVREALFLERFVREHQGRFLVRDEDGKVREVILR